MLTTLACSTEIFRQQVEERAESAAETAVAKAEVAAQTRMASWFETAKANIASQAPQAAETAQARILTQAPLLADTAQAYIQTQGPEFQQTTGVLISTESADMVATLEVAARGQLIMVRAYDWIDGSIRQDSSAVQNGYRTDSVGYVAYGWNLRENGQPVSPDAVTLGILWSDTIRFEDLHAGDALNNMRSDAGGHAVLFESWIDEAHTQFVAYTFNPITGIADDVNLTLVPSSSGGYTIQELDAVFPGPYYPQRKK
jgi:hypothetical protein